MLIGIVIGIALCFAVFKTYLYLDKNAVFYSKNDFKENVIRFNYFWSKDRMVADKWLNVIEKMLEEDFQRVNNLIKYICIDPVDIVGIHNTLQAAVRDDVGLSRIESLHEICVKNGFHKTRKLIETLADQKIKKIFDENHGNPKRIFGTVYEKEFLANVVIPAARKIITNQTSISQLEEIRVRCIKEIRELIDERELEILKAYRSTNWPDYLLVQYQELREDSPAEEFWLNEIETALNELASDVDIGLVAKWLNEIRKISANPRKDLKICSLVLSRLVPIMDKDAVVVWAPNFIADPVSENLFSNRIKDLYVEAEIKELVENYNLFKKENYIREAFDALLKNRIDQNRNNFDWLMENLRLIPVGSESLDYIYLFLHHQLLNGKIKIEKTQTE